jgi:hypothetical protein
MALTIVKKARGEERLSLRLSSQAKFSIELLARIKETSLSRLVLDALELKSREELTRKVVRDDGSEEEVYLPEAVWDPLMPDRLVKLATYAAELLTEPERVQWTVISENNRFWTADNDGKEPRLQAIRSHWDDIQAEAEALMNAHAG